MKVAGDATLSAPVQAVWSALNDPDVLIRAIPGCERLEISGVNAYNVTMSVAITAIRCTFTGEMRVAELKELAFLLVKASVAGGQGAVDVDLSLWLAAADGGGTRVRYEADAAVAGLIAGVGQWVLAAAAKRVADAFISGLDEQLSPAGAAALVAAAESDRPGGGAGGKIGLVAGGAVGLAGVVVGAVLGKRHHDARRSDRA